MRKAVVEFGTPIDGDGSALCARDGFYKFHLACARLFGFRLSTDFSKRSCVES